MADRPDDLTPDDLTPDDLTPDLFPPIGCLREEVGDANIPPALAALYRPLPELLFVLYDPRLGRYCYRCLPLSEDCGLLCFRSPEQARDYARVCLRPGTYDKVLQASLDQAHALARERHALVNCLLLIDESNNPGVHYVR